LEVGTDVGDPRAVRLSRLCACPTCVLKSNACAAAVAGCLGADRRWRSVRGLEIGTDVGDPRAVRLSRLCVCPTCVHKSNARAGTGVAVV